MSLKPQPLLATSFSKFQMASKPDESFQQASGKPMDANWQNVFNALKTTYWKAAHREICTMILFFTDVLDQGRKVDNFLAMDFAEMKCDNFTEMFDLWRKFMLKSPQKMFSRFSAVGGQRQGWEGFDTSPLYEETIKRARGRLISPNSYWI